MAKKPKKATAPDKAGAATESLRVPRASAATVAAADQAQAPGTAGASQAPAAVEGGASPPSAPQTGQEDAAAVGAGAAPSEQKFVEPEGQSVPAAGAESTSAPAEPPAEPETPRAENLLVVHTKRPGTRRRAGRSFGPEASFIPLEALSTAEREAIDGDPELVVKVVAAD